MTASARRLVMLGVAVAMLAAAGSAPASAPALQVNGAGYTSKSGHVVINARATGAQNGLTAPATGFVKIDGSAYGDLTGSVSCIGTLGLGPSAAVSGTFSRPVTIDGQSYSTFTFLVGSTVILYVKSGDPNEFDCGVNLFFSDPPWGDPAYALQSGHFTIH